ncbi:MAG TPA: hypothetical protein VNK82_07725 [Terriglobales bacterium]|nr:hypothetical protein [Terriglobales bacterium]
MGRVWQTIRSFILWEYARGSWQYDVMVTLIVLFVLFSPYWINFNDKPVERAPHPSEVTVRPDGQGGFVYRVEAAAVPHGDAKAVEAGLLRVIEPMAGEVTIVRYVPVRDASGKVTAYDAWVQRQ